MPSTTPTVPADAARRLLMDRQGLLADPTRRATPAAVHRAIERMGYVQIDTISVVERAHHHVLLTRFDGYRPRMLAKLLERDRKLFEHWTHDLCAIPSRWFPCWRSRFSRAESVPPWEDRRWRAFFGPDPLGLRTHVLERLEKEGPLLSRDFERAEEMPAEAWAGKPARAMLDHLLRCGRILVTRREGFQRVFDLAERVLPDETSLAEPDDLVDWACRTALERLVVATPGEIRDFFRMVDTAEVRAWCRKASASGEIVEVAVESLNGQARAKAVAHPGWRRRAARTPPPPDRMRLLSPFDPVVRDRKRTGRRFGFDYRFEAFVPAAKRQYGYYVLPLLDGERLVGRLDPKLHRDRGHLEVKSLWWEPGIRTGRAVNRRLEEAVERYATGIGAETWSLPPG